MNRRYSKKKEAILNQIPIFLSKTYQIVDNPEYSKIITWGQDGQSFVIKDVASLTSTVLPKHFKHNNFASFVRQLNMYGFTKVRSSQDGHAFKHQYFRKDSMDLLTEIKRKNNLNTQNTPHEDPNQSQMIVALTNNPRNHTRQQQLEREVAKLTEKHKDLQNIVSVLIDQNKEIIMQNRQFMMKMNKKDDKYKKKLQSLIMLVLLASRGNSDKGLMIPPQASNMIRALREGENINGQTNIDNGAIQLYKNKNRKTKNGPNIEQLISRVLKSDDQMESADNLNLGQQFSRDFSQNGENKYSNNYYPSNDDLDKSMRLIKVMSQPKDNLLNQDLVPPPSPNSLNGSIVPPPSPIRSEKEDWSDIFGDLKNDKSQPIHLLQE